MRENAGKSNPNKPQLSLVSTELMEELASVRARGSEKHGRDNWKKGQSVLMSADAALRHLRDFIDGKNRDEDGLSNLGCVVAQVEHIIYALKHYPELDDRAIVYGDVNLPQGAFSIPHKGFTVRGDGTCDRGSCWCHSPREEGQP